MTAILKVDTIQDTAGNNIINESSDTITIGASGDTTNIVGTLQNNGSALNFATVNGITGADQWRLTTNFTGDANPIASNLERNDTTGAGFIGTAMSQSSGIFSFPSTGIWHISFLVNSSYNGENRYCQAKIQTTVNNSSYIDASISEQGISTSSGGTVYASQFADTIFDVTDTSNCKIKFYIDNEDNSTTVLGSSTKDATCFRFIRLGDT